MLESAENPWSLLAYYFLGTNSHWREAQDLRYLVASGGPSHGVRADGGSWAGEGIEWRGHRDSPHHVGLVHPKLGSCEPSQANPRSLWDLFPSREWAKIREHLQGGWILQIWSLLWTGREQCNAFSRFQLPVWGMTQHLAMTKRMGTLLATTIVEATRARIKCHQVSEHVISFLTGGGREHYRLLPRLGLALSWAHPALSVACEISHVKPRKAAKLP